MQPITIAVLTVLCSVSWACVDLTNPATGTSDCPNRANLCTSSSTTGTSVTSTTSSSSSATCVDRTNPSTGTSDCTRLRAYCNNSIYIPLMRVQCPRTCNFCTSG
ncbi:Protein CBG11142 [Caenorhabditis briggsae]|uniref:Protein CBG11142 n=1 Tax=Caenorhabditis briggsae TaxID=6238 RepID=A8XCJ6_CAEBR|nr:Protein CBG11142 [Caenorhabditis briggsae]CAP30345.2 Protein CBG11142 [Caenorhabditis briggsae]